MNIGSAERRFSTLAVADDTSVRRLAERILAAAHEVEVVRPATAATMLIELTESVQHQPFYLGEVVVSEATVRVDGCRGDAVVIGHDLERALAAAVCDAAAEAGVLAEEVEDLVARTQAAVAASRTEESNAVASTRVSFEVIG